MKRTAIGTSVPFDVGEKVYDRLTREGPWIVVSVSGDKVHVYKGNHRNYRNGTRGMELIVCYTAALAREAPPRQRRWWLLWLA